MTVPFPGRPLAAAPASPFSDAARAPAPLSINEILDHLDLDQPLLVRVRTLVAREDFASARAALRDHFVQRPVRAGFWPEDPRSALAPDDIVQHVFSFYGSQPFDAGTPIRWNDVFLNDREITYALNRHQHLATLAAAYRATKNPRYAQAFVDQVRDWIRANPPEADQAWAAWRNLEVATRIGVWSDVFFQFAAAPAFTPDDQALMLASLRQQTAWLAPQVREAGGDWGISLATGLAAVGVLFPEFKEAAAWRGRGGNALVGALRAEGNASLLSFWLPFKLAVENRVGVPEGYGATLERMCAYQAYLRRPDGKHPAFNASDPADLRPLLLAAGRFFHRPDFEYIVTNGRSGAAPTSTSCAFRESGVYVMRDGWGADANYLAIDAGPYGTAYQHEDKLGFELAARGRTVLVDPGRYSLDASDPLTDYLARAQAHNTVVVDGGSQMRARFMGSWRPAGNDPVTWISRPGFDYFAGAYANGYEGAPEVRHVRRVFFLKDKRQPYWILSDLVSGEGNRRVSSRFQFGPGAIEPAGALGYVTNAAAGSNLAVCPPENAATSLAASILTGSRDPWGGWVSFEYRQAEPAPQLVYDCRTSLPATLHCALVPLAAGARPPAVRAAPVARADPNENTSLELDFGDFRDTVFLAHDRRPADRTIAGVRTKGSFAVVRTPKAGQPGLILDF